MFLDCNTITIGDNTLIGPNVQIYTPSHPLKAGERFTGDPAFPFRTSAQPVSIGSNVWIGGNVVILPGVTIGDGTTIGAGSIVTGDIPANVLALGQPCRVIRALEWGADKAVFPTAPIVVIIAVCGRAPFVEPRQTQVASNSA